MTALQGKPWEEADDYPEAIFSTVGMLGPEERRCLFYLAKTHYAGRGTLVDAGAFLGASACSLAAGLALSGRADAPTARIYSYDYFRAVDEYVVQAISERVRPISPGDSFLDIFETQTAPWSALIEATAGDFSEVTWSGAPIEILFIDVAKTLALHSHVVQTFFPHLIPGHSVVIHQDYHHAWHPYIHVAMEYLDEYFELIDPLVQHQSRVWTCNAPIPDVRLRRVVEFDFSPDERAALLDRRLTRESGPSGSMLKLVRTWDACQAGDYARARRYLEDFEADGSAAQGGVLSKQSQAIKKWLAAQAT